MDYLQKGVRSIYDRFSPDVTYHGLFNPGAKCYLNSVLQVLFMSKDFRAAVARHTSENSGTECIDRHLATLFEDLQERTADICKITRKLGIDRVHEQRDAAEYFEKILNQTSPEASQIFHGLLTHKTICSTCHTETEADEAFWHLTLALVDSYSTYYSVKNGIEEYFRDADFSGENQMYCDQCDAKSDATVQCAVKHHPEVLMLLLKRFEFNYSYMSYVKNNCAVDVPCSLQIPKNQTYELYAVVEHFGDLRSGHYIATIKSQDDGRWYSFDDSRVTLVDFQPFQADSFEKSNSAYLLYYRKEKVHVADTCTQDIKEVSPSASFLPAASDISDQCKDAVKIREREEGEGAAQADEDLAVAVSINRNEERGSKDSVGTGEMGLSPDPCYGVENQHTIPFNNQECKKERQAYGIHHLQDAYAERQRDECKIIMHDQEDVRGDADADDQAKKRETLSGENKVKESVEEQDNDSGRHEQQRGEERDAQGVQKQQRGHDKYAQRTNSSEGKQHCGQDDEDQNFGGLDRRHNRSEQKTSFTHTTQKDLGVERHSREQKNTTDEHNQNREECCFRGAGAAGSRGLTENQGVCSAEKKGRGGSQPKARLEFNESMVDSKHGSVKSKVFHGKIIEDEIKVTPSGTKISRETKEIRIENVKGTSHDGSKSWVEKNEGYVKRKSDPKISEKGSLSKEVRNLKLRKSPLPEQQNYRNTGVTENAQEEKETDSTSHSNALTLTPTPKMKKASDAQVSAAGLKYARKKGGAHKKKGKWWYASCRKQHKKKENKQNKTTGCWSFPQKKNKKEGQTSESD